jgi:hypothetical protein
MASVMFYILVSKKKIFLSIQMASVICVNFSRLVDHYGNRHPPHNTNEHPHAKILVSPLECQLS